MTPRTSQCKTHISGGSSLLLLPLHVHVVRHFGFARSGAARAVVRVLPWCTCDLVRARRCLSLAEVATSHPKPEGHPSTAASVTRTPASVRCAPSTSCCAGLDVHGSRGSTASRSLAPPPHGRPAATRAAKEENSAMSRQPEYPLADFIATLGQRRAHDRHVQSIRPTNLLPQARSPFAATLAFSLELEIGKVAGTNFAAASDMENRLDHLERNCCTRTQRPRSTEIS